MKNIHTQTLRKTSVLMLCLLLTSAFSALLAGCGKKDEAPPGNGNYYNGPLAPKNSGAKGAAGGTKSSD